MEVWSIGNHLGSVSQSFSIYLDSVTPQSFFVRPGAVSISISAVEAKLLQEATSADS